MATMPRWLGTAALAVAALGGSGPAQAGCDIPFEITTLNLRTDDPATNWRSIQCKGPWFRESCAAITPGLNHEQFYCAEQTMFFPEGDWNCTVSINPCETFTHDFSSSVGFCYGSALGGGAFVDLQADNNGLTVLNQPLASKCATLRATATATVLGHAAGGGAAAAADVAPSGSRHDVDTFTWRGRGGGPVRMRVERDPAGGGVGERARVKLVGDGGRVLGRGGGALPLEVRATVPASGVLHVVVEEAPKARARGGGPGGGEAFRGHYRLSVYAPGAGAGGRLEPQRDVEH